MGRKMEGIGEGEWKAGRVCQGQVMRGEGVAEEGKLVKGGEGEGSLREGGNVRECGARMCHRGEEGWSSGKRISQHTPCICTVYSISTYYRFLSLCSIYCI